MKKPDIKESPLSRLIDRGDIYVKDEIYVGRTPTGEVQIGNVGGEKRIIEYLADYPEPTDW
jgi:hypothetical protein